MQPTSCLGGLCLCWAVALRALIRSTIREDYSAYGESVERLDHG